jgi:hypothetical protein
MNGLRPGAPINVAGITLIPIERVRIDSGLLSRAWWLSAAKEAVAVVLCGPEGPRAVDVEGRGRPVDELLAEVPGLESLLARVTHP